MDEYNITTPFFTLTLDGYVSRRRLAAITVGLFAVSLVLSAALLYLYAVVFAAWVGFETAVLVGLGLLILTENADA